MRSTREVNPAARDGEGVRNPDRGRKDVASSPGIGVIQSRTPPAERPEAARETDSIKTVATRMRSQLMTCPQR